MEDFSFLNTEKLKNVQYAGLAGFKVKSVEQVNRKKTPLDRLFSGVETNNDTAKDIFLSYEGRR